MGFNVTWKGLSEAEKLANQMASLLLDLRPFWPKIVPLFVQWQAAQFATEGGFMGDPWAPLSPRYAEWKAAHYPGKPILQAEGDLRRAASAPLRDATPTSLTLTIADDKAGWHQEGTARMPARPLMYEISAPGQIERDVQQAADEWVDDLLRRLR